MLFPLSIEDPGWDRDQTQAGPSNAFVIVHRVAVMWFRVKPFRRLAKIALEVIWLGVLVGGWATPLKNMSSSIGMISNPIYGKIKHGNQTTNQLSIIHYNSLYTSITPLHFPMISSYFLGVKMAGTLEFTIYPNMAPASIHGIHHPQVGSSGACESAMTGASEGSSILLVLMIQKAET